MVLLVAEPFRHRPTPPSDERLIEIKEELESFLLKVLVSNPGEASVRVTLTV
jgi:hypothetical protein